MGIDTERFRPVSATEPCIKLRRSLQLPDTAAVILSCGRVERRKGYEHLIRALGVVNQRKLGAYLVIAGRDNSGGQETARLHAIAEEHGVLENVRMTGQVAYDDLPLWYAMCDLYAGASLGESPGLTYVEAMACRRAVVALRSGAIPEVVQHEKTGLLVDPDTPYGLADAVERLLSDRQQRDQMARSGEEHALDCFSLNTTIPQHAQMYVDVITQQCKMPNQRRQAHYATR
jgi:phosphatidylinositol alpha-1,6-mannosyltransferase